MRPGIQRQQGSIEAKLQVILYKLDGDQFFTDDARNIHGYFRPSAAASICVFVVSSVAHQRLAFGPSSGYHFASGRPPMIFFSSSVAFAFPASLPRSSTNSWNRGAPSKSTFALL